MRRISALVIFLPLLLTACAQVPKQSVELSATVGRDLTTVYEAHRQLAKILFADMRSDVNRFIDEVYAPFQISNAMNRQRELAASNDPEDRRKSLFLAISNSLQPDASPDLQMNALKGMGSMVLKIQKDIESMRNELLDTLDVQEEEILDSIDRAYQQLHYANSIVTGHLASIVAVHDAQAELLKTFGVKRDIRKEVGENLADASDKIRTLVDAAESADDKLGVAEAKAKELKEAVRGIGERLGQGSQEE